MMNKILHILLPLFYCSVVAAQAPHVELSVAPTQSEMVSLASQQQTVLFAHGVIAFSLMDTTNSRILMEKVNALSHGNHAPALHFLGRICYIGGNYQQALKYSTKAVQLDSLNPNYLREKAMLLMETKNEVQAMPIFEKLWQMDPTHNNNDLAILIWLNERYINTDSTMKRANIFEKKWGFDQRVFESKQNIILKQQRYDDALGHCKWAMEATDGKSPQVVSRMADIQAVLGQFSLAQEYYQKLIMLDSTNVESNYKLAYFFRQTKRMPEYLQALYPIFAATSLPVPTGLGILNEVTHTYELATKYRPEITSLFRTFVKAHPNDTMVLNQYGTFLFGTNQWKEATEFYTAEIEKGHASASAFKLLCHIYYRSNQKDKIIPLLEQGLKIFPTDETLIVLCGDMYGLQGKYEQGREHLKRALKLPLSDSVRSIIHCSFGDFHSLMGKYKESLADYARSLKLNPDNVTALNNWAYFTALYGGGNIKTALLRAERANELSPQNPTFLDTKAWVLYTMGRYEEAKQVMLLTLGLEKVRSADILEHYGDILYALGEDSRARNYWQQALDAGADKTKIQERLARPQTTPKK
ncbi:MAG: hypothetical protein RSA50_01250 [Mucinivorans sp.]